MLFAAPSARGFRGLVFLMPAGRAWGGFLQVLAVLPPCGEAVYGAGARPAVRDGADRFQDSPADSTSSNITQVLQDTCIFWSISKTLCITYRPRGWWQNPAGPSLKPESTDGHGPEGVRTLEGGVRKLQTRWPGLEFG